MNATMKTLIATSLTVLMAGTAGVATAQVGPAREAATPGTEQHREKLHNANEHINKSLEVLRQMQATPQMAELLSRSKGVFIVPDYGRAALGVGVRGGAGVLLTRMGNTWSNPAFYNMGGVSVGLQAGAEAGAVAFVLNDQKAMNSFMQNNKFSLNAGAGLTLVDYSRQGMGTAGWGNITVWSDTEGLFAGVDLSITDVDYDEEETAAYYRREVAARDVLTGKVNNPNAAVLSKSLANITGGSAAATMGASGTRGTTSGQMNNSAQPATNMQRDQNATQPTGTSGASGTRGTTSGQMNNSGQPATNMQRDQNATQPMGTSGASGTRGTTSGQMNNSGQPATNMQRDYNTTQPMGTSSTSGTSGTRGTTSGQMDNSGQPATNMQRDYNTTQPTGTSGTRGTTSDGQLRQDNQDVNRTDTGTTR